MELKQTVIHKSADYWHRKGQGKILVTDAAHIPIVFAALCEQDDYWDSMNEDGRKDIFQVVPNDGVYNGIESPVYYGRRDIYDPVKFVADLEVKGIPVFLFSEIYVDDCY
jgi:hypothetical protein